MNKHRFVQVDMYINFEECLDLSLKLSPLGI